MTFLREFRDLHHWQDVQAGVKLTGRSKAKRIMELPFTTEQFLDVFRRYNLSVWPLQVFFYVLALVAVVLSVSPLKKGHTLVAAIVGFFWIWMGTVYHLYHFAPVNPAAYVFGVAFIFQGILFLYYGFRKKLSFRFNPDIYGITGGVMMFFALAVYPLLSYWAGRLYPATPTFGLPCPTTIFTLGMLLWVDKKVPGSLLIVPVGWAVIGYSAALIMGITEDMGLGVSAVIAVLLIWFRNDRLQNQKSDRKLQRTYTLHHEQGEKEKEPPVYHAEERSH